MPIKLQNGVATSQLSKIRNVAVQGWAKTRTCFGLTNLCRFMYAPHQSPPLVFKCCSKCPCLLRQYLHGIHHSNGIPKGKYVIGSTYLRSTSYCCWSKNLWTLSQRSLPTLPAHPAGPNPHHPQSSDELSKALFLGEAMVNFPGT